MIFPEVVSIVSLVGSIDFFLSLSFSHYQRTDKEDRVLEEENNRVLEEKEINEGLDAVLEAWMYYREKPNKNEMYLLK